MKVYYEMPDLFSEDTGNEIIDQYNQLNNLCLFHIGHKFKYRVMWELRHLEKEIDSEGGVIVIKQAGQMEAKEFSAELLLKIKQVISGLNLEVW
jgi:hypothetical protein